MIALESHVQHSPHALAASVEGGLMILHLETGKYFHLDAIGAEIWAGLAQPAQVGALCARLAGRYDAAVETVQADALALLADLAAHDLIRSETGDHI